MLEVSTQTELILVILQHSSISGTTIRGSNLTPPSTSSSLVNIHDRCYNMT